MQKLEGTLHHLAVGLPKQMTYEETKKMKTGICKENVDEVYLAKEGFRGDGVADLKNHGGFERAVCLYSAEHYPFWEKECQAKLPPSAFGENLTVAGMTEKDVCIGDVFQAGDAVIQVTQGRVPCKTIDRRTGLGGHFKRIVETGYTGYFCKVLEEGIIRADSNIRLVEQDGTGISVLRAHRLYFQQEKDCEGVAALLEVHALAEKWRRHFRRLLD
ncbi:MOSC domain-containing protein [Shouchella shacheensis]|uniref:MOSC domain-containing protein n=1 Tax=Shouchella shacheensis TaxID=1649580 RepID=UPI00073FFF6E|nr:MOSC domain-containing protein [Shouchella shacheensis]